MTHQLVWEENGLYRKFTDKISGNEVLNSVLKIQSDPRFDKIRYVLNDFTEISDFEVSETDIKRIVSVDNAAALTNANIKIAIVATNEPLLQWIQYYCDRLEKSPYEVKVFSYIDDAYRWIPLIK